MLSAPHSHTSIAANYAQTMMMIGEISHHRNPTVQIPQWDPYEDQTTTSPSLSPIPTSPFSNFNALDSLTSLHRYLPSNEPDPSFEDELDLPVDAFSCDHFRMYEFKVKRCARGRSHDWTECPYAHPGEKARRRDPRRYHYSGTACPEFRKGGCKKGDSCEFAHGVFRVLAPSRPVTALSRVRTGPACRRRVCFFAHTPEQLRLLPQHSPKENGSGSGLGSGDYDFGSPFLPPSDSPPMSPVSPQVIGGSGSGSFTSMSALLASMRGLQWVLGVSNPGLDSGLRAGLLCVPGFCSLPTTPTRTMPSRSGLGQLDIWGDGVTCEEEPAMERVESGRNLRAKIYAKLSKENSVDRDRVESSVSGPDVGWVSELRGREGDVNGLSVLWHLRSEKKMLAFSCKAINEVFLRALPENGWRCQCPDPNATQIFSAVSEVKLE
ncbi:hypothetical protein OIU84_010040 [Salix udensis]|uniref:C3H1-type domain-containing protein n=1 Tax=Salix udensis TaxID=889485 RepID=A0AAD6JLW3_9ROSI|nr:hypothetical protein OIU84_010040 [Salix udensis]